jgi:hypothetical protein
MVRLKISDGGKIMKNKFALISTFLFVFALLIPAASAKDPKCPKKWKEANKGFCYKIHKIKKMEWEQTKVLGEFISLKNYKGVSIKISLYKGKKLLGIAETMPGSLEDVDKGEQIAFEALTDVGTVCKGANKAKAKARFTTE